MLTHGKQALQNGIKLFHEFKKSVALWHDPLLVRSNWQCGKSSKIVPHCHSTKLYLPHSIVWHCGRCLKVYWCKLENDMIVTRDIEIIQFRARSSLFVPDLTFRPQALLGSPPSFAGILGDS